MTNQQIYINANLTADEVEAMPTYLEDGAEFYDTTAFTKLFEYFAFETGEMPYGTAKARDGDPDQWILETLGA